VTPTGFAPAKVNLFLHVGPLAADGYHPLSSLVVFADVGDRLGLSPAAALELVMTGPFAAAAGPAQDNLVLRALGALEARAGLALPPLRILLDKQLPVAAGLGGGSSDAGALLRLIDRAFELELPDDLLVEAASEVGADGPMCLQGAPALALGRGDVLTPAPILPELHAVLVNPGVPSPTGAVYRAYDEAGARGGAEAPPLPDAFESAEELAAMLAGARNDLEAPAVALQPAIGEVLDRLADEADVLLARMSGSGATCFALCPGDLEARSLSETLSAERPGWWVQACRLGGPWD
jgi:4-diphosphocytidyl-2-C-methyl-D-erythritol kinase